MSEIRLQECLYAHNESVLERYEEGKLFQNWAREEPSGGQKMEGGHLINVLPFSRKIYVTYAEGCCEVCTLVMQAKLSIVLGKTKRVYVVIPMYNNNRKEKRAP